MDGLFKKTMSYLNAEDVPQDEFVGKIVEVAAIKLKILRKIAEGENFPQTFFVVFSFWDMFLGFVEMQNNVKEWADVETR